MATPYIVDDLLKELIRAIQIKRQPVVLYGEPGTGKTEFARYIATLFDIPLYEYICTSESNIANAILDYKYLAEMRDVYKMKELKRKVKTTPEQLSAVLKKYKISPYVVLKPIGRAMLSEVPSVLLIDEIDKAPEEFPDSLLDVLASRRLFEPESGILIEATEMPYVVMTSNQTKPLSEALKRRALCAVMEFPPPAQMVKIVVAHYPDIEQALLFKTISVFYTCRDFMTEAGKRPPSTSELIDWTGVIQGTNTTTEAIAAATKLPFAFVLIKDPKVMKEAVEGTMRDVPAKERDLKDDLRAAFRDLKAGNKENIETEEREKEEKYEALETLETPGMPLTCDIEVGKVQGVTEERKGILVPRSEHTKESTVIVYDPAKSDRMLCRIPLDKVLYPITYRTHPPRHPTMKESPVLEYISLLSSKTIFSATEWTFCIAGVVVPGSPISGISSVVVDELREYSPPAELAELIEGKTHVNIPLDIPTRATAEQSIDILMAFGPEWQAIREFLYNYDIKIMLTAWGLPDILPSGAYAIAITGAIPDTIPDVDISLALHELIEANPSLFDHFNFYTRLPVEKFASLKDAADQFWGGVLVEVGERVHWDVIPDIEKNPTMMLPPPTFYHDTYDPEKTVVVFVKHEYDVNWKTSRTTWLNIFDPEVGIITQVRPAWSMQKERELVEEEEKEEAVSFRVLTVRKKKKKKA